MFDVAYTSYKSAKTYVKLNMHHNVAAAWKLLEMFRHLLQKACTFTFCNSLSLRHQLIFSGSFTEFSMQFR